MRTTDFSTILLDAINLCGYDTNNISDSNFRTIRQFANQRLRMAWEAYPWFSLTKMSEQALTKNLTTGITTMDIPSDCGEIVGVYRQNPLATTQSIYVSYALTTIDDVDKIVVMSTESTTLFVEYRIKRPEIQGAKWTDRDYAVGSYVYFDAGSNTGTYVPQEGFPNYGNFYVAKLASSSATYPTNSTVWTKIEIPYIFASYISRGIYSDFLRSEQQYDDAAKAESDASGILEMEFDKELRQQGQIRRINFIQTY
jgi:hypothetical protein